MFQTPSDANPYQANNKLVWQETIDVMQELFEDVWGDKEEIIFDHALELPFKVSIRRPVTQEYLSKAFHLDRSFHHRRGRFW